MIPTVSVVGMRCPECGKVELHRLSLFAFAGNSTLKIECACGSGLLGLGSRDRTRFWLQLNCPLCEGRHIYHLQREEIWSADVLALTCEESGVEVAFLGERKCVQGALRRQDRSLAQLAKELGVSDYFENPDLMYQLLESIYGIAESGNLSCECGNQNLEMEIFPDRVELRCGNCGASSKLPARQESDLWAIQQVWRINLTRNGHLPLNKRPPRSHLKK